MSETKAYFQTFIRRRTVKLLWDNVESLFLDIKSLNFELQDIYNQNIIYKMDDINRLYIKDLEKFISVSYKAYIETMFNLKDGINTTTTLLIYIDNAIDNIKSILDMLFDIDRFLYRSLSRHRVLNANILEGYTKIQNLIDDVYWLQNKFREFPRDTETF